MGLQVRTKKRIFLELCRAEAWALDAKSPHVSSTSALATARNIVAKNNGVSLAALDHIADQGVHHEWPESDDDGATDQEEVA